MKNIEIERKWVVKRCDIPYSMSKYKYKKIEQGYISKEPTVRIRKADNKYFVTIKKDIDLSFMRYEFEYEIKKKDYENLKDLVISNYIVKKRYYIPYKKNTILIDFFKDSDLILAEVEFKSKKEAENFNVPQWLKREVTNNKKYTNLYLSFKKK